MRILMLGRYSQTGVVHHILSLARELNRQGIPTISMLIDCPPQAQQTYKTYCKETLLFSEGQEKEIITAIRDYNINFIHLHSLSLIPQVLQSVRRFKIPWGTTVHERNIPPNCRSELKKGAFLTTPDPTIQPLLAKLEPGAVFIPEGIDLKEYKPGEKRGFSVTFIAGKGSYSSDSYHALQKAVVTAGLTLNVICPEKVSQLPGSYHGWPPQRAPLLQSSQVVAGSRRNLLEAMACGCVALVMGKYYYGILTKDSPLTAVYPSPSGQRGTEPCYKHIFYDLSRLLKDQCYVADLQEWGRKYIREYHDLRLTGELTGRLYRHSYAKLF